MFNDVDLKIINDQLTALLIEQRKITEAEPGDYYHIYTLSKPFIQSELNESEIVIEQAFAGYYHHRLLIHFELTVPTEILRDVRKKLKLIGEVLADDLLQQIHALVQARELPSEAEAEFYYLYPIIVVHAKPALSKKFPSIFSAYTTTLSFKLIDMKYWLFGRKVVVRISIPSLMIYARSGIGSELKTGLINLVYEACLYKKKMDEYHLAKEDKKKELSESNLVNLWMHAQDTLGGKTSDFNSMNLTVIASIFTVLAVLITLPDLIESIIKVISFLF